MHARLVAIALAALACCAATGELPHARDTRAPAGEATPAAPAAKGAFAPDRVAGALVVAFSLAGLAWLGQPRRR